MSAISSISWPQSARRQTRTRTVRPLISLNVIPIRVGRLQAGQTIITFDTLTGAGISITPPGSIVGPPMRLESLIGRGFLCRLTMFSCSTITRWSLRPRLEHLALLPAVLAAQDLDEVALLDLHRLSHR